VSVALKKIEGVESAKISLNDGRARIALQPGNSVRLEQIRKAVNEQGFTPKEARVKALGDLTSAGGQFQFKVSGSKETFPVMAAPHASWFKQAGENVLVTGIIAAPRNREEPGDLQVLQVSKPSPSRE
jgi:copper chaperone CopZ